jgi:agmatine deiminase
MRENMWIFLSFFLMAGLAGCGSVKNIPDPSTLVPVADTYTLPDESMPHEGTWLQWPHHYQYGRTYRNRLDATWMAMTKALETSETVHIIAYDETEKERIIDLLNQEKIPLTNIDFKIYKTDDVWVRDNGPIYVKDQAGEVLVEDWGFNGWGNKAQYANCNAIPTKIGLEQQKKVVNLNTLMINEGGSVEIDGEGTLMACKSSILNKNRNPNLSQAQAEEIFRKYLGATHFIWLDGQAGLEITDQHIDGFARFGNATTVVTMNEEDLLDYQVKASDISKLYAAKNKKGKAYSFLKIPLTKKNVQTEYGKDLGYKGSYINYYIANKKVLVPNYHDENDALANAMLQGLYPSRKVVGIDVRNLYANGGMVHCVTQQQPR